jgi:hypothetical protein
LVSVTKKPTYDAVGVVKTLTMPGKSTARPVDLEDPAEYALITGKTRRLMDIG